jgi:hypothetical protein
MLILLMRKSKISNRASNCTCIVPRDALESLWTSYNLLGEGWGLDLNDFKSIMKGATHLDKNIGIVFIQ